MQFWIDLGLVFALTLISSVFVAAEFSLVNLRESQLSIIESKSKRGKIVAKVARDPDIFLSASQIGVTFVGFFSASFGAEKLRPYLLPFFESVGIASDIADALALVIMVIFISYLSLVFGEFLPKKLAIQYSERIAIITGPPLDKFAVIVRPLTWLVSASANMIYRLFGGNPNKKAADISDKELQNIVEHNQTIGSTQREILTDVLEASDRSISEIMRPRADVVFISANLTLTAALKEVQDLPYSRYPVIGESFDDVIGFVHVRDLFAGGDKLVSDVTRNIIKFPGTNHLISSMRQMRKKGIHLAIVLDEYGGTDGICTLEDIIEEMIGDIHDEYDLRESPDVRTFKDGTFSVGGELSISDFADETNIALPDGPYETVAGYIFATLGRVAKVGDTVEIVVNSKGQCVHDEQGEVIGDYIRSDDEAELKTWVLSVTKLDGMRIQRIKLKQV